MPAGVGMATTDHGAGGDHEEHAGHGGADHGGDEHAGHGTDHTGHEMMCCLFTRLASGHPPFE